MTWGEAKAFLEQAADLAPAYPDARQSVKLGPVHHLLLGHAPLWEEIEARWRGPADATERALSAAALGAALDVAGLGPPFRWRRVGAQLHVWRGSGDYEDREGPLLGLSGLTLDDLVRGATAALLIWWAPPGSSAAPGRVIASVELGPVQFTETWLDLTDRMAAGLALLAEPFELLARRGPGAFPDSAIRLPPLPAPWPTIQVEEPLDPLDALLLEHGPLVAVLRAEWGRREDQLFTAATSADRFHEAIARIPLGGAWVPDEPPAIALGGAVAFRRRGGGGRYGVEGLSLARIAAGEGDQAPNAVYWPDHPERLPAGALDRALLVPRQLGHAVEVAADAASIRWPLRPPDARPLARLLTLPDLAAISWFVLGPVDELAAWHAPLAERREAGGLAQWLSRLWARRR